MLSHRRGAAHGVAFVVVGHLLAWAVLAAAINPAITQTGTSAGASRLAALLVYGNPNVVHDAAVPELLLEAVRERLPAVSSSEPASGVWWQVARTQPIELMTPPLEGAGALSSAAYVIPFQGPDKQPYAVAEGAIDHDGAALSTLHTFVRAGGNLIMLGNTAQDHVLELVEAVLRRPHGCVAAVTHHVLSGGARSSLLLGVEGFGAVQVPHGGAGGEPGGVGMLRCAMADSSGGAIPWVYEDPAECATGASPSSVVGSAFAWSLGRGRVVWLGATFDEATSEMWLLLLVAAAAVKPVPKQAPPPESPVPRPPSPVPPGLWRKVPPPQSPPPPGPVPTSRTAQPSSQQPFSNKPPAPSPPRSSPTSPSPFPQWPPPTPLPPSPPPPPRSSPSPSPTPPSPFPRRPPPTPLPPSPPPPPRSSPLPSPTPPSPFPRRPPPTPLPPSPPPPPRSSPSPSPTPPSPFPRWPPPTPLSPSPPPPRPSPSTRSSVPPPPSPAPQRSQPSPSPPKRRPPSPQLPQPSDSPDAEIILLPPDAVVPPQGSFPLSEPTTQPADFTAPPDASSPPAEITCMDYPDETLYNCTSWMEIPDMDFCQPDFFVPSPNGEGELSVLDVCPRSCGMCCADKYIECEQWRADGYCASIYLVSDPDTGMEETVPQTCQESCGVC